MNRFHWLLALVTLPILAGCDETSVEDHVLRVDATGVVQGVVFFDQNGSESPDPTDDLLPDIGVWLVQARGGPPVASDVTDAEGVFVMPDVPVGTYRISVDPSAVPDSIEILDLDETFILSADDTVTRGVRASFPALSLAEVADLPPLVRVFTAGIALNPRTAGGDGAVHLQEGGSYLRATNVNDVSISPGDSVRFRGRTALEAGRIVLDDVTAFVLRQGAQNPTAVDAGTGTAAGADGGRLNAGLVRVTEAEVLDTASVSGGFAVTVDDGSGPIDLLIRSFLPFDREPLDPGFAKIAQATGLLVKESAGEDTWRLLPRIQGDLVVESFPLLDVIDIWGLPADRNVTADGIVLNPVSQPVPGTIHIRDEGVHLRIRNVEGVSPLPGDSVRVRGRTARSLGRTLLDAELVTVLSVSGGSVPLPAEVSTGAAAAAGGSSRPLDAGLVRVSSAQVSDTATVAGEFVITADDGSGSVDIVLTPSAEIETNVFDAGTTVLERATGLLVPHRGIDGILRWRIVPRFADDLVVQ